MSDDDNEKRPTITFRAAELPSFLLAMEEYHAEMTAADPLFMESKTDKQLGAGFRMWLSEKYPLWARTLKATHGTDH
jgi:hypothetical protein